MSDSPAATTEPTAPAQPARQRIGAIDAVKGVAIIFVLILHAFPDPIPFSFFWVRQAVPLLMVIMGYLGSYTRVKPLKDYFKRRFTRLVVPWAIAWVVALLIVIVRSHVHFRIPDVFVGALPTPGPGNYFITIAFAFVLILPLLRWLLDKGPWVLLGVTAAIDLGFQLASNHFALDSYLWQASILRYLFAIALGMLMARGRMLWALVPVSLAFIIASTAGFELPFIHPGWPTHFLLAAGYTTAIVWAGLKLTYPKLIEEFGRDSWHIFLVQIIWFGQFHHGLKERLGLGDFVGGVVSVLVCLAIGVAFARAEGWVLARISAARAERDAADAPAA